MVRWRSLPLVVWATLLVVSPVLAQDAPGTAASEAPAAPDPGAPAEIDWLSSYGEALERARAEDKPVLLYFTSPG